MDDDDDVDIDESGGGDWIKMSEPGPVIFPGLPPSGGVWPPQSGLANASNLPNLHPGNLEPKSHTRSHRGRGRPRKCPPPMKGPFHPAGVSLAMDCGVDGYVVGSSEPLSTRASRKARGPGSGKGGSYVCELCSKSFATWAGRYFHMAKHTGQYKIKCDLCDKGFMKTDAYKNHMMMHRKQIVKSM